MSYAGRSAEWRLRERADARYPHEPGRLRGRVAPLSEHIREAAPGRGLCGVPTLCKKIMPEILTAEQRSRQPRC